MKPFTTVDFLGVKITSLSLDELLEEIEISLTSSKRLLVGNVNVHAMNLAVESQYFRDSLKKCDIVFCDGFGVKLGAALLGTRIKQRFTPPDFIDSLMRLLVESKGSVFLLGSIEGIAEKAGEALQRRNPGLVIAGSHHGFFNKNRGQPENQAVVEMINGSHAKLLLVGLGMPAQEQWLVDYWEDLNVQVAMTVGALFDTVSGAIPRAPKIFTEHGMEWLARLVIEPGRLWKRYLIGLPTFFGRVLRQRFSRNPLK